MKKILILTLVSIYVLPNICMADVITEKALTKEICTKFMGHISSADLDKAFETIEKYVVISETELDSAMLQTRAQLDQYGKRFGKTIGYEFIEQNTVGDSLIRYSYLEKRENHALLWVFDYYKNNDGWVLNTFKWSDNYQVLFTHK